MKQQHSDYYKQVLQYCDDIKTGKILSCIWVKKAVKRFLNDLKREKEEGWQFRFDEDKFVEVVEFAENLKLADMDSKLKLLPWQLFIYANLFGFVYKDNPDRRRFRQAYNEVARKNGKTSAFLYPMILYDFITTNAAESYLVSKDGAQATKSFEEVTQMIHDDPEMEAAFGDGCHSGAISYLGSRISFFSSESTAIDGYRNSLSVIDEFWCYANDKIVTAFRFGGRARLNNLVCIITSAGLDIGSPCYAENKKAKSILSGSLTDESYFCIIYCYDEGDDWQDPKNFIKANPSLGAFLKEDVLLSDLTDAQVTPSHRADFKSKTCGIWTNDVSNWIPVEALSKLGDKEPDWEQFTDIPCYAGMDLSSVNDLSVYTLCWKKENKYYFKHRVYIPESTASEKYKTDNINFTSWIDSGIVKVTPGSSIDYSYIYNDFIEDAKHFKIKELTYDPWKSKELINRLNDELPSIDFIEFPQNLKNFSEPTKNYEKDILDGNIYDPNPILYWCIQNVVIKPDSNGNYKPMKEYKSATARIDLVISSIEAHCRCKFHNRANSQNVNGVKDVLKMFL